jgi:hypothetical protein
MNSNYTKTVAVLLFSAAGLTTASAQVTQKIGTNPFTKDVSAALEIESTIKGFLPPRMTLLQRDAIVTPANGLIVYNTTSSMLEINTGTSAAPVWKAATVTNAAIASKTGDYTVVSTDHTIIVDLTAAAVATLTLPAAADNIGKIFFIEKVDEAFTLTFTPALKLTNGTNVATLNYAKKFIIQSNGTNWIVLN